MLWNMKKVPGRKTDVQDSEWLAELARCGLLNPSFIPPQDFRELRFVTRYLLKLAGYMAGEKNRLQKLLDDSGIKNVSIKKPSLSPVRRIILMKASQNKSHHGSS
jgi:transposase